MPITKDYPDDCEDLNGSREITATTGTNTHASEL